MTTVHFVGDDELHAVFRVYADVDMPQQMGLYEFKCAMRHIYGTCLKKSDLKAVLGDEAAIVIGKMSIAEFVAAARAYERWKCPGGNANKELMQQCFTQLDTRDKGYVDANDVARLLWQVVPRLQQGQRGAQEVFAGLDELHLNKVTFPRFCALYTRSTGVKCSL